MDEPQVVLDWMTGNDQGLVTPFYEEVGYTCVIHPEDRILTAREGDRIVAAVRLCREENSLVLRGMYVAPDRRGRGIGSRLLDSLETTMGPAKCWCVPFAHLQDFYSRIGFSECTPEQAPEFLKNRAAEYEKSGLRVIIMKKGSHGSERV